MKRPSFQFYPGDWKASTNLRRCSFQLRGIWIEVMCLMHDSEEYGILRWELEEIASSVGCSLLDIQLLVRYGVLKGVAKDTLLVGHKDTFSDRNKKKREVIILPEQMGPIWFSSRMVRDEYLRESRGQYGVLSLNNPNVPSAKDTLPEVNKESLPEVIRYPLSSSSSSSNKDIVDFQSPVRISLEGNIEAVIEPKKEKAVGRSISESDLLKIVEVVDYLNLKTGKVFRPTTGETKYRIIALFKAGYTIENIKKVIDNKSLQWKDTVQDKFLRPETLFGNKFEGYLNEKIGLNGSSQQKTIYKAPVNGKQEDKY